MKKKICTNCSVSADRSTGYELRASKAKLATMDRLMNQVKKLDLMTFWLKA